MNSRKKDGFTLVELLAVFAVLAVIIVVVVPSATGIIKNGTKEAFKTDVSVLAGTIELKSKSSETFVPSTLSKNNLYDVLSLKSENYNQVSVTSVNDKPYLLVVGKNKWQGLTAYGTLDDMTVYESTDIDVVPPKISLYGSSTVNMELGSTYVEAGAFAIDNVDGNISDNIVIDSSAVNTNVVGTYSVTYNVTDSVGNQATQVVRTINVLSVLPPEVAYNPNGNTTYQKLQSSEVAVTDNSAVNSSSLKYLWNTSTSTPTVGDFSLNFNNYATITSPTGLTGSYYLWIYAKDIQDHASITRSSSFALDNTAPTAVFSTNGNSTYAKSHSSYITVSDAHSGLTSNLKYQWNTSATPPSEGTFSETIYNGGFVSTPLGVTGGYYLWVLAEDNASNKAILGTNVFNLDNTVPTVTFGPNGNSTYATSHSTTVTASDAHTEVNNNSLKYVWSTSPLVVASESLYTTPFTNGSSISTPVGVTGTYYLKILAKDILGNTNFIGSSAFNLDNTAPTVAFGTNGNTTYATSHSTTVTVTDANAGVNTSSLKYQWTTSTSTPTEGSFTTTFTNGTSISSPSLVTGGYYLWILAKDATGNTTITRTDVFNLDNTTPTVAFGLNGNSTYATSYATTVTVSDSQGVNTSSLEYQWTTSTSTPTEGSFTTTFTNGASISTPAGVTGSYYLWILAKDNAGNTTITRTNVFNLDNTVPTVAFGMNGNSTYATSRSTMVTVSDAGAGVNTSSLKYQWTNSTTAPTEGSFTTTFTNGASISSPSLVTGSYYLWILAKDTAGNTTITRTNVFNLDNTAPTVAFGTNGNTTYATSHSTTVTVSDANAGVNTSSLKYQWTNSTTAPTEGSFTTTFTNGASISSPSLVTGGYYLWILAKDTAGNTTITRTNVFNLDNTAPTVAFGMNGNSTYATSRSTTVTVSDAGAGVNTSSLEYQWTTSTSTPTEGSFSTTFTNGASISTPALSGGYYLWILAKDTVGNTTITRTDVFNIDNAAPSVAFDPNGNSTPASSYSTTVTVTDANSGVNASSLEYQWTTSTSTPTEGSFSTTFTNGASISTPAGATGSYYLWILAKDNVSNTTITRSEAFALTSYTDYIASEGVNKPRLHTGMTAIKWNGSSWDNVADPANDTSWYNYTNKEWANAKTADGSYWVWIPRYAYQIATNYHTNTVGTINIKFLIDGTDTTSDSTTIETTPSYSGSSQTNYVRHPGFTFGTLQATGIWVAKFEPGGELLGTPLSVLPGVDWNGHEDIATYFTGCREMEGVDGATYGWGTSGAGIDTHLIKNIEWGAVAYLTQSVYGKNSEVWINPDNYYKTGRSGSTANSGTTYTTYAYTNATYGVNAGTTGNPTGIFDMNGSAWEYVAAYVDNGKIQSATSLVNAEAKYKDIYTKASTDSGANNYAANSSIFGDAVYETSSNAGNSTTYAWYGENTEMPYSTYPVFVRGGVDSEGSKSGLFSFDYWSGAADTTQYTSYRPVFLVDPSL